MKPLYVGLEDEAGTIRQKRIVPDGCLVRLWKRVRVWIGYGVAFVAGWIVGQVG